MKRIFTFCCALVASAAMFAQSYMATTEQSGFEAAAPIELNVPAWQVPAAPMHMPAATAAAGDTLLFNPQMVRCAYCPNRNMNGMYYFMMTLQLKADEVVPQIQLHFLSNDTLSICDNPLLGAVFYLPTMQQADIQQVDLQNAKVVLGFRGFGEIQGQTFGRYYLAYLLPLPDGTVILGQYDYYVIFYYDGSNVIYVPTNEEEPTSALEDVVSGIKAEKVMIDGEILIHRGNALYDLQGRKK